MVCLDLESSYLLIHSPSTAAADGNVVGVLGDGAGEAADVEHAVSEYGAAD